MHSHEPTLKYRRRATPSDAALNAYGRPDGSADNNSPRPVIRGESSGENNQEDALTLRAGAADAVGAGAGAGDSANAAITDYLNFSFPFPAEPSNVRGLMTRLRDHGLDC